MTAIPRLKLGTASLLGQGAGVIARATVARYPQELRAGAEVWVYFRRWQAGVIQRIITRNPAKALHGRARGDIAVVAIAAPRSSNVTVRRLVHEVVLASDDCPESRDRKAAQEFAREWWIELARSL